MADITISIQAVDAIVIYRPYPFWRGYSSIGERDGFDVSGILSGTVTQMGVLQKNALVSVYYRRNGNLVARVRTDDNGNWSVPNLDKSVADYFAVAQTESDYNAVIYDKLTPV